MYRLEVFLPNEPVPYDVIRIDAAAEVLRRLPEVFSEHGGCEKVVVYLGVNRLFALDCHGVRLP